jgi:hypothetical protein
MEKAGKFGGSVGFTKYELSENTKILWKLKKA